MHTKTVLGNLIYINLFYIPLILVCVSISDLQHNSDIIQVSISISNKRFLKLLHDVIANKMNIQITYIKFRKNMHMHSYDIRVFNKEDKNKSMCSIHFVIMQFDVRFSKNQEIFVQNLDNKVGKRI